MYITIINGQGIATGLFIIVIIKRMKKITMISMSLWSQFGKRKKLS